VIEQAIETAALMLGTDKSRGYCLEMICADFLAGAQLDNGKLTVQRCGHVKGAVCSRSSQTLGMSELLENALFEKARVKWRKKWRSSQRNLWLLFAESPSLHRSWSSFVVSAATRSPQFYLVESGGGHQELAPSNESVCKFQS